MCMMFHRLVPCPGLSPKWCVCFGVCFSWSRLALFIAQTCTNHCNMQTNEAPVVRRKTSSGDSSMGHPPWGILHIAIPMRQYLSLVLVLLLSPFAICQCPIFPCPRVCCYRLLQFARLFADPHSKCRGSHRSLYCCSSAKPQPTWARELQP